MSKVGAHLVLGLASVVVAASPTQAATLQLAAPEASAPKSSSWWLRAVEAREQQGEYAKAGDAYRQALEALSEKKQRANEGARAALLSAEAYWQAFDRDPDPASLDAGLAVLEQWLTLTGPQSRATLLSDVQRTYARMKAVRDPLVAADPALTAGDAQKAAVHYDEVLDALASQQRDWSVGARISLNVANTLVTSYEAEVHAPEDITAHLHELRAARDLLTRWKDERPPDDASEQGPAVERALADVQARLDEAEQTLADEARAEQIRRAAAEAAAKRQQEEARAKAMAVTVEPDPSPPRRTVPIVLLSTGIVAMGAGAALIAGGVVIKGNAADDVAREDANAAGYAQMFPTYDLDGYQAARDEFVAETNRISRGMLIGGSVLVAGGVATSVAGIVLLVKGRRSSATPRRARARLSPVVSPTQLQLSISGRF
jgi:hypothetical protein